MKKFRLPPGLGDELDEQLSIENKVSFWMIKRLHERGFSQIKTPLLEYFELFEDYRMPNQKMYRLGARDSRELVIRPDMTLPVARFLSTQNVKLPAKFFVVMKRINDTYMLVAPVFETQKKRDCKGIRVNNRRFWVNFMTFYVVPEKIMEAVPGKYLDYSYKTICAIYDSHNNVLREKWRKENEKRIMDQEHRRMARERKKNERRCNMDYLYPVPEYLQRAARRPYSGGLMAAR